MCGSVCVRACVRVCERAWLCGGLPPDTGCGRWRGSVPGACLQWTRARRARGCGRRAPACPASALWDGAGAGAAGRASERESGLGWEAATVRRGCRSVPPGLRALRRRGRWREGACFLPLSFFNFAALPKLPGGCRCLSKSKQTAVSRGDPERCCAVVVHLRGLVGGFVIFILVAR